VNPNLTTSHVLDGFPLAPKQYLTTFQVNIEKIDLREKFRKIIPNELIKKHKVRLMVTFDAVDAIYNPSQKQGLPRHFSCIHEPNCPSKELMR
jgi:hypothetical protein